MTTKSKQSKSTSKKPHKLDLYRLSVQHPLAEVSMLHRIYGKLNGGQTPKVLKEDFAGNSLFSMAWVACDMEATAIAVDNHGPTLRWAQRKAASEIGYRTEVITFIEDDVCNVTSPKADVVCALNFSSFIWHDVPSLTNYFRNVRKSLKPDGIYVMDMFGGPGAMRQGIQSVPVDANEAGWDDDIDPFEYQWEQRTYDAVSGRIDCRIHFKFADGSRKNNAFRYDWRLWTLPELTSALSEAGFSEVQIWCDRYDAKAGQSDGVYRPVKKIQPREDWIAYVAAKR